MKEGVKVKEKAKKDNSYYLDYIEKHHDKKNKELADELGISYHSVARNRRQLIAEGRIKKKLEPFINKVTEEELNKVIELYENNVTLKEMAKIMGWKDYQLQAVIRYLRDNVDPEKFRRNNMTKSYQHLEDADICYMIDFYDEHSLQDFADIFDVSVRTIYKKVNELVAQGIVKKKHRVYGKIDQDGIDYIRKNYGKKKTEDLADKFGVAVSTIHWHVRQLRKQGYVLEPRHFTKHEFSSEEIERIKELYAEGKYTQPQIAEMLGRDKQAVSNRIYKMISRGEIERVKAKPSQK